MTGKRQSYRGAAHQGIVRFPAVLPAELEDVGGEPLGRYRQPPILSKGLHYPDGCPSVAVAIASERIEPVVSH